MGLDEYSKGINTYISEYIKIADAKAGSIIGFTGLVSGAIATQLYKTIPKIFINSVCFGVGTSVVVGLLIVASALVFYFSFLALLPRTPKSKKSLNSFPDIASFGTPEEYADAVKSISSNKEEEIAKNYSYHNWVLSNVAMEKFANIKKSLLWLKASLIITIITGIVILIGKTMYGV